MSNDLYMCVYVMCRNRCDRPTGDRGQRGGVDGDGNSLEISEQRLRSHHITYICDGIMFCMCLGCLCMGSFDRYGFKFLQKAFFIIVPARVRNEMEHNVKWFGSVAIANTAMMKKGVKRKTN